MTKDEVYASLAASGKYYKVAPVANWTKQTDPVRDSIGIVRYFIPVFIKESGMSQVVIDVESDGTPTEAVYYQNGDPVATKQESKSIEQLIKEKIASEVSKGTIKAGFVDKINEVAATVIVIDSSNAKKTALVRKEADNTLSVTILP